MAGLGGGVAKRTKCGRVAARALRAVARLQPGDGKETRGLLHGHRDMGVHTITRGGSDLDGRQLGRLGVSGLGYDSRNNLAHAS